MILKNYYELLALCTHKQNQTISQSNIKNYEGNFISVRSWYSNYTLSFWYMMQNVNSSVSGSGGDGAVIFGTGTTAPTFEDYTLSGNAITGFNYTVEFTENYSNHSIKATYTITNTSGSPFTISEVALRAGLNPTLVFVERTLLDNPVTIPAGGVGQVEYTIQFNVPTS